MDCVTFDHLTLFSEATYYKRDIVMRKLVLAEYSLDFVFHRQDSEL
jgi:hypothetical protein